MTGWPEDRNEVATTPSALSCRDALSSLPPGWTRATLGDLVSTKSGNSKLIKGKLAASPSEGLVSAYSASGQDVWTSAAEWHVDGVVLSAVGARCGKTFLASGSWTAIANTHVLIPKAGVDPRWLWYLTNDESFWSKGGTAQPFVKMGASKSIPVLLPPFEEQRRIAAVLDAAEELRAKRRRAFDLLGSLRTSVVLEHLADLSEREPLGSHLAFVTSGSRGWAQYYSASGSRFVRSQDVLLGEFDDYDPAYVRPPANSESKRTRISADDLLITITGVVGKVAVAPSSLDGAFISQHVAIARLSDSLRPRFVEAYLCSDEGQRQLERVQYGQTKPGLNLSQIRELRVPVPTTARQVALLADLDRLTKHRSVCRDSATNLETLFASLQQRAFRGEL